MPAKNTMIRDKVLKTLKDAKYPISRGDLATVLNCEAHTLPLKQMKDEGTVVQHGARGAAKYTIAAAKPAASKPTTPAKKPAA